MAHDVTLITGDGTGPELAAAGLAELITFDRLGDMSYLLAPSVNGKSHSGAKVRARA